MVAAVALNTDASVGSQSTGWGIIARCERGRVICKDRRTLRYRMDSNLAEMQAAVFGVRQVLRLVGREVPIHVFTDNKNLADSKPLLGPPDVQVDISHIYREENWEADRLAKVAMRKAAPRRTNKGKKRKKGRKKYV